MARHDTKVARRYARALFEALTPVSYDQIDTALKQFVILWQGSEDLREALVSPAVFATVRAQVLGDIVNQVGVESGLNPPHGNGSKELSGFFNTLLQGGRLVLIAEISEIFTKLVDEAKKILALELTSAQPLSDAEKGEITAKLQSDFGGLATVSWSVDSQLIGGMVVRAGDKLVDSSLRGALSKVREALLA